MADDHGPWSQLRGARRTTAWFVSTGILDPEALRLGARSIRPLDPSLDLPARPRSHLFLSLLLSGVSDSRTDWPRWNSSRRRTSATDRSFLCRKSTFLVRPFAALDLQRFANAAGAVLGGHDRLAAAGVQSVAAGHAGGQLRLLSFLRRRGRRFLQLSIRRHASRSRIPLAVLCSTWAAPRTGSTNATLALQPVSASVGVVPHLLRVRNREAGEWRSAVAQLHGDG